MIKHSDGTETHVGTTLFISNMWDMSMDITTYYANVWENGKVVSIYAYSDYEPRNGRTVVVDATPEVKTEYEAYKAAIQEAKWEREAIEREKTPEVGKEVVVVKGRKVPIGTQGTIFWKGVDNFKSSRFAGTVYRYGIKDSAGNTHWVPEANIEVLL